MTEKSLGQVLYENDPRQLIPWHSCTRDTRASYESQAQALAVVVREQAARLADEIAAAIRSMKP